MTEEIILPAKSVTVAYRASPMSPARELRIVQHGMTIAEIVDEILDEPWQRELAAVVVDGVPVPRAEWHRRPDPNLTVQVVVVPQGGQDMLRVALVVGLIAFAAWAGPFAAGSAGLGLSGGIGTAVGAGITAGITLGGMLAINALIPPGSLDVNDESRRSNTYAITGGRNEIRKFDRVPMVFGEHRMYPPFCATPTFDVVDDDVWFLAMVAWGAGKIDMANIELKIGDTPIEEFQDVQIEHFDGTEGQAPDLELYSLARQEIEGAGVIEFNMGRVSRTTGPEITKFTIELVMPRGLIRYEKSSGDSESRTLTFVIESRKSGTETWFSHGEISITAKTTNPLRRTYTYDVTDPAHTGTWDIAITRTRENTDNQRVADESNWTALRTYRNEPPVRLEGCAVTTVYMRSSGQLSGVTEQLNGIPRPITKDYDEPSGQWVERTTSNPASQMIRLLQHAWAEYQVDDTKIDWPSFEAWHDYCRERDLRFDFIMDYKASRWEMMDMIATAGDATYGFINGQWRVYVDQPRELVAHVFSPRTMRGFRSDIIYYDRPEAIRVTFQNAEQGYQADEIIIPLEGFTEDTANKFETLEFPGKVRASEIQRRVRRRIVEAEMRDQQFTWFTDIASLTCEKFDLVIVQHDRILSGVGNGRVVAIEEDGAPVTQKSVRIDSEVTLEQGRFYAIAWPSRVSGVVETARIRTTVGQSASLVLEPPLADGSIELDDMVGVVEIDQNAALIGTKAMIKEILPEGNFGAQITAVPYREEIYTPDTEPVPEWTSKLTLPPGSLRPVILNIYSDESVAERLPSGDVSLRAVVVIYQNSTVALRRASGLVVRWKLNEASEVWQEISLPIDAGRAYITPVIAETTILVQARWIWTDGTAGDWTSTVEHSIEGVYLAPPDVDVVFQDGDIMRWQATLDPDHGGFLLRTSGEKGTAWSIATPIHDGYFSGSVIDVSMLPAEAVELLVKSVTMGGIESENAGRGAVSQDERSRRYPITIADRGAAGFPGTIIGGEVIEGALVATTSSILFPATSGPAWAEATGPAFDAAWDTLQYETTWAVPLDIWDDDRIEIEMVASGGVNLTVQWASGQPIAFDDSDDFDSLFTNDELLPDDDLPFGSRLQLNDSFPPVSYRGPIVPIPGELLIVKIVGPGGQIRQELYELRIALTSPERTVPFSDVIIPVGGVRLADVQPFRQIIRVVGMLQADGSTAQIIKLIDKSQPLLGPLVKAYDVNGVEVQALADIAVTGI